jgi:hypothetical protein
MTEYPKAKLMKLNATVVLAAWIVILACLALFAAGLFGQFNFSLLLFLFSGIVLLALLHLILAIYLRCFNCGKRPTVQGLGKTHSKARKRWGMVGWSVVIIDVLTIKSFRCIHCGEKLSV